MEPARLQLRIDKFDEDGIPLTAVTILIDGEDRFTGLGRGDYMGMDAGYQLGPQSPLLPTERPRRIALYRCSCGIPEDAAVVATLARDGEMVTWSDLRVMGSMGSLASGLEQDGGISAGLADIVFNADEYLSEVARIVAKAP